MAGETHRKYAYTPGLVSFGDSNILMAQLERPDMATTLDQSPSTSSDTLVLNLSYNKSLWAIYF